MEEIVDHSFCNCGAVTVYFENGENNSLKRKNLKKFGLSLKYSNEMHSTYACNHCVNHYGLDICECGSGLKPEKCCRKGSREQFGESVKFSCKF